MLYSAYEACNNLMRPVRALANNGRAWLARLDPRSAAYVPSAKLAAAYELMAQTTLTHSRPQFAILSTTVEGRTVPVREEALCTTSFGTLVHFVKENDTNLD